MTKELYKKYRPSKLRDIVGQPEAVAVLQSLEKSLPHAIILTGPSGTGKTTIARILARKLKCNKLNFHEINSADLRGIDTIRDFRKTLYAAPLGCPCRVHLIDEAHQLTPQAQDAFLKQLEDTPDHIYFMLATTEPKKLKKTILTRCTEIRCQSLNETDLISLVNSVAEKESIEISTKVAAKIAEVSEGSARKALVQLNGIINIQDAEHQINAILATEGDEKDAITLVRALIKNPSWKILSPIIKEVKIEPEKFRHLVLAYCSTILLRGGQNPKRIAMIMEEFTDNFYDSKKAGIILACYNLCN